MAEWICKEMQMTRRDGTAVGVCLARAKELVRCKDCKHGEKPQTFRYYPEITWCNKHSTSHNDDWFCADGERRDG
jgi:hypothetical protein